MADLKKELRLQIASFQDFNQRQKEGFRPAIEDTYHPLCGVFQARPSLPRHSTIWDVGVVFKLLRKWSPAKCLSRKQISLKMAMLLLLLSAERGQTVLSFDIRNMTVKKGKVIFYVVELTKTSRPGAHKTAVELPAYAPDRRLCVVTYLKEYLSRTEDRNNHTQLLVQETLSADLQRFII